MSNKKEMCSMFTQRNYKENKKDEKQQESLLTDNKNTSKILTQSRQHVQRNIPTGNFKFYAAIKAIKEKYQTEKSWPDKKW